MVEQHTTSIDDFATAMLAGDEDFASRVKAFEDRFGPADSATLGLLAAAVFFCDVHCDHPTNLLALCEAVGSETPDASLYHCGQISPEQWDRLHEYVVAAQRWRGLGHPTPEGLDAETVDAITASFGPSDEAREALVELFLDHAIDSIFEMTFTRLGSTRRDEASYADYSAWYVGPDGRRHPSGDMGQAAEQCRSRLRALAPDADELVDGILTEGPPACVCKFTRYLAIQAASIGALKWRGDLPKMEERTSFLTGGFLAEAKAAFASWRDGRPAAGDIGKKLCALLGPITERKEAVVFGLLNIYELPGCREPSEQACDWLAATNGGTDWDARKTFGG
ncbi:MAG: hypothetical protein ACYS8X_01370 [Planctomycetota bacterium]|jgi:hypothetical protein